MFNHQFNELKRKIPLDPYLKSPPRKLRIHNNMFSIDFLNYGNNSQIVYQRTNLSVITHSNEQIKLFSTEHAKYISKQEEMLLDCQKLLNIKISNYENLKLRIKNLQETINREECKMKKFNLERHNLLMTHFHKNQQHLAERVATSKLESDQILQEINILREKMEKLKHNIPNN